MVIKGDKVVLKPMTADEIPLFYKWATQSDATPFWYQDGKIPTLEQFLDDWKPLYFDSSQPEKGMCFAIVVDGRAIGQVNYNEIDRTNDSVELDIIIADDVDKSKGYGTDALKTLSQYLIENMNVKIPYIIPVISNHRAIRAYQKAGFKIVKSTVTDDGDCYHMELDSNQR